jgi:Fe-S oxidoreductase
MDLCISCKACKSECPSSVDLAKLKAEWLYHYQQKHGVPLRSRLFGNYAGLIKVSRLAPAALSNAMLRGPVKWLMTAVGVHPKRELPALAPQTFSMWWRKRRQPPASAATPEVERREVVLFHDTFMEHNQPQIGQAAVKVLEAAGYRVTVIEKHVCCGRPAISIGQSGWRRPTSCFLPHMRGAASQLSGASRHVLPRWWTNTPTSFPTKMPVRCHKWRCCWMIIWHRNR